VQRELEVEQEPIAFPLEDLSDVRSGRCEAGRAAPGALDGAGGAPRVAARAATAIGPGFRGPIYAMSVGRQVARQEAIP
jgi:hypothetical protein